MVFLDASIIIYFVEQPLVWGPKASARLADLRAAGESFGATDLVRMECLVGPIQRSDAAAPGDFMAFFTAPDVAVQPITPAVAHRAATIRATYRFRPMDSLHLAAAAEHGCGLFLTNDIQLRRFTDIMVEVVA